ncbi:MAG: lamin tail domain-containing protein [Planctomycetota bacterium]|jgi:hypothetical protein
MKISLFMLLLIAALSCPAYAQLQLTGDLNDDQRVDHKDLRIYAWQWLDPACMAPGCSADLDGINGVNLADFALLALNWLYGPKVVINEIHYDPDVKTELVEFVELYNSGTVDANISGWYFSEGISYQFQPGTILPAGGYIIVAQDPGAVQAKFGTSPSLIFGPFGGRLENDGEELELRNAQDFVIDVVDYRRRFPWPIVGDPPGYSIELVNPELDNDLGGSWRPSEPEAIAPPTTILPPGRTWSYLKGLAEASSPIEAWREYDFDDLSWPTGNLPIGYGENFIVTTLSDMQGGYTSVFLRKKFTVTNPGSINYLWLDVKYDDGWNAWINGKFVKGANVSDPNLTFDATAGPAREDLEWNQFLLPHPSGYLETENVLAIQLFNSSKSSSSDCFLDVQLVDRPASSSANPTPSQRNTTYSVNIPPQMRQVKHRPKQPRSGDDVRITVKVTDPDGVKSVILSYQLVHPGSYIEITDPQYETNWTDHNVPMTDDGTGSDEEAGDDIYTVVIPGSFHTNRLLVRYRITATDNTDLSITGPYAHDPQPNFAYFVYDGVPAWSGAIEPSSTDPVKNQVVQYSPSVLTRIPVYHLISKKDSVEHATWIDRYGGDLYKWKGTLVYEDEVYDHIRYRMRGGVWRYAMGKNMWKFDFNRGHFFQARDDYGKKYDTTWDKLNFSACIQQGDYLHRGEQGMIEAASFLPFNLMGVEAPKTHWVHYRIIDEADEFGPTQYIGDFWGLYMVIEQMDGRFLDEHGLPDGNLYKIEGHNGELNNQGPNSVADKSDLTAFKSGYYYDPNPDEQWWRDNVNLESYYGYRAVVEGVHHGDIGYGKNYFFFLNPETNIWDMLPWDLDLCWANNMYGNGEDPFKNQGAFFSHPALKLEYENRLREFHDLLYNSEQMDKLLDDLAAIIDDPGGGLSIVDADRAMWDYNPIMTSGYVNSSKAGKGRFYQQAATKDFRGMVQIMKDYVKPGAYREFDTYFEDAAMPYTPTVTATGPSDYPINALTFETTAFSDPQGSGTFAAMKWRIAEVTDTTAPAFDSKKRRKYEIETVWDSGEITDFNSTIKIPASVVEVGHAYRVRVRMKDNTGRWSHWSNYVQFIAGDPTAALILSDLRITELMYNPAPPAPGDPNDNDEFEFIELKNIGPNTIDLTYVSFTDGITFDFNDSSVTSLDPGDFVLVVRNKNAFESRYGTGLSDKIAGEYKNNLQNSLANDGENIKLVDFWNGPIAEFNYKDDWYSITDGDGFSLTMIENSDSMLYGTQEGLVSHWKFDDGSGNTATDSTGTNNGTLIGSPTWTTGRINGAISFDGIDDYVAVSPIVPLLGNSVTAQAWIRTSEFAGIWNPILTQNAGNGYYFYVSSGRPSFYIVVGAAYVQAVSSETINANQWYHVAGTNDGSYLKLYINGQMKDSATSTGFLGVNSNACIGYEPTSQLFYSGLIDDVRIYNRALSESEFKDIVRPMGLLSRKSSWRSSVYRYGSPGWDDSGILPSPGAVVVNEVMAHSNDGPDWIELYNTTDESINIGGWFLSDNDRTEPNLLKYRIADGTTIEANDYLVFYQDTDFNNPGDPGCLVPFGLSENGEKACLSSPLDPNGFLTGYREIEDFGASQTNVSIGRYFKSSTGTFNFVAMDYNTPDVNNAYPKVGPIVINEIMYNPQSGNQDEEYIELHNITGALVKLYRYDKSTPWKFTDGIDYTFSASPVVTIQAYGYLILAKDLTAFTIKYGSMPPGVQVLEDYQGWLNNDGEKLEISMPGDTDESLTRHYIRIDRINYSDGWHPEDLPGGVDYWPREADGLGKSLSRKVSSDYGNDVANWEAATPSPGAVNP